MRANDNRSAYVLFVIHNGAKLCQILLTRDVKTVLYQLLLVEEIVPNVEKHFGSNFLFVHNNVLSHRA